MAGRTHTMLGIVLGSIARHRARQAERFSIHLLVSCLFGWSLYFPALGFSREYRCGKTDHFPLSRKFRVRASLETFMKLLRDLRSHPHCVAYRTPSHVAGLSTSPRYASQGNTVGRKVVPGTWCTARCWS